MAVELQTLELIPAGTLVIDSKGLIKFANSEAKKILGLSDFAGRSFLDFLDEEDLNFNQFLKMSTGQEIWIRDSHKVPKPTFIKVSQVESDLLVVIQDISNLKESELRLLTHSSQVSFGEIASLLVHDLANPLAIISSKVAILRKKAAAATLPTEELEKFSDSLSKSADRMTTMLKKFRSYAKDDAFDPVEVLTTDALVARALTLLRKQSPHLYKVIRAKKIKGKGQVLVKPKQMTEVLKSIFQNAGEAAELNKSCREPWVELELAVEGDKVQVSVIDSGKGPQTENPEDIFGLFYSTKGPGAPHGMGLAAAKKIVERSQGSLELVKGAPHTQFLISLPLHKV